VAVAIDLVKRIPGHHGDISRIEIREPTFGDYVECGPIVRNVWSDDAERPGKPRMESIENPAAIMKWAVALTGIPESVLRLLGWKDARAVMGEVFAIVQELEKGNSQAGPTTSSSRSG